MSVTVTGKLKHGLKVGDDVLREFELREATTGDMFDAEEYATIERPTAYQGALIACQLVRLGNLTGPIDFALIRKLHPEDFGILVEAQREVERLGEAERRG